MRTWVHLSKQYHGLRVEYRPRLPRGPRVGLGQAWMALKNEKPTVASLASRSLSGRITVYLWLQPNTGKQASPHY